MFSYLEHNVSIFSHELSLLQSSTRTISNTLNFFVTLWINSSIKLQRFSEELYTGIKIEDGSYIGAGSVVTKNVKKNSVIVGVPGKYLKSKKQVIDLKIFNEILQYK